MNKHKQVAIYIVFDVLAVILSWTLFFIYRKVCVEGIDISLLGDIRFDNNFWLALLILPVFWIAFYYVSGFYGNIFRHSRLIDLGRTLLTSITGVVVIFFALLLDDQIYTYRNYYQSFFVLLLLHFIITYIPRLIISTRTVHRIHKRIIGFNTLIVGSNARAVKLFKEMNSGIRPSGNIIIGYVSTDDSGDSELEEYIPNLGSLDNMPKIIDDNKIEEIILAIETSEHSEIQKIISILDYRNVTIKAIPDMYDILAGTVKTATIYASPLVKISNGIMPVWQENVKRLMDIVLSLIALIICLPFFPFLYVAVKLSSKGSVFYSQKRVGRYGKEFSIYKLRSMVVDAEKNGPALSSSSDPRITKFGQFMRRTHIDEIPQFYNVLRGDMSLVGPRPERRYYINEIRKIAPVCMQLQRIRPGITSWGQVKYGYASNVKQMVERLPYDLIYLKNISIYLDVKILIYTLINCFQGKGK